MIKTLFMLTGPFLGQQLDAKELALSFDDGVNPEMLFDAKIINNSILKQLHDKNIRAIIYPSLIKTGYQDGLNQVAQWCVEGHRTGNHSQLHLNLNKPEVNLDEYLKSIENADKILSKIPGWVNRYRFPYLKEGHTTQKRNGVRAWVSGSSLPQ